MGCCFGKPTSFRKKTSGKDDVDIEPGLFVTANTLKFIDVYEAGRSLGQGGYGEVREATHRDSHMIRAVKILTKESTNATSEAEFLNEVNVMKSIDHPNIVRIYEYFDTPKKAYIVMELCKGGELFDEIIKRRKFSEDDAAFVAKQLFSAVDYLHDHNVIHRDLKPQNILLENKGELNIKVSDFGISTISKRFKKLNEVIGTAYFMAPEVISGKYDFKCDLWSCGVIIYMMLSGRPPFQARSQEELFQQISQRDWSFREPVWADISRHAKDLISALLSPVETRMNAKGALAHPWIQRSCPEIQNTQSLEPALINLQSFQSKGKLRDALSTFITLQCISNDDTKGLKEVFRSIDKNGDGKISKEELLDQYIKFMGQEEAKEEVKKIMREVDTDKSGYIDYTEFLKATMDQRRLMSVSNLKAAFAMFDKDKTGTITKKELKDAIGEDGRVLDKIWRDVLSELDTNGDGEIDFEEFENVIMGKMPRNHI